MIFNPRHWNAAHPEFNRRVSKPTYSAPSTRKLLARNEFAAGSAIFMRADGLWRCTKADPPLKFLLSLDPIAAKMDLIKRGFTWEWEIL